MGSCGSFEVIQRPGERLRGGSGVVPGVMAIGGNTIIRLYDRYVVPVKASVRKAENLEVGDTVAIRLEVR
ncbi:MAG: DUF1905 domain-containing protein [Kouleothrix sp.]|nr:DUF1905 domain-containing protein [Kouleothrix sp.]